MLTFSTIFPLSDSATLEGVDYLLKNWLAGSPHSSFDDDLRQTPFQQGQWQLDEGNERAHGMVLAEGEVSYVSLSHEVDAENGIRWRTEVTFRSGPRVKLVSVQVFSESEATKLHLPPARKPYIVRQLIEEVGGGQDGDITVCDRPIVLGNSDIEFASDLVLGACDNKLPLVYVSAAFKAGSLVDCQRLAQWLSGIAHVVVEPNREFSFRLAPEVNHQNTYGGAIGIYWPDRSGKVLILPREFDYDSSQVSREVSRVIRDRAVRLRLPRTISWAYQRELLAKQQIERMKREGSSDLDEYISNFDAEISSKNLALEEAEREIARLQAEVYGLRSQSKTLEGSPALLRGGEKDLYENETIELLHGALMRAIDGSHEGSRRRHVLESLIGANPVSQNGSELADRVKSILSNYQKMDASIEHDLEELGFEITSDGKHHKMTFRGDSRYTFSVSKTSSDHRSGKNLVSEVCNKLF